MINTNVIGATIVTREGSKFFDHNKVMIFICCHVHMRQFSFSMLTAHELVGEGLPPRESCNDLIFFEF